MAQNLYQYQGTSDGKQFKMFFNHFQLLQDTQLISLIFVLLLIDGLVVTLWVTLDPMERYLRNLTLEINPHDRGVVYQPQVCMLYDY